MINWLRRHFCKHEFEFVKRNEDDMTSTFVCKKCKHVIRVTNIEF